MSHKDAYVALCLFLLSRSASHYKPETWGGDEKDKMKFSRSKTQVRGRLCSPRLALFTEVTASAPVIGKHDFWKSNFIVRKAGGQRLNHAIEVRVTDTETH